MGTFSYPKRFVVYGHQRMARSELEDLRSYARLATSVMSSEADKHTAHVERVVNGMSEDEREAYFYNNSDTHELMLRRFPNQQQQSLVVLTYTVVETRLISIARALLREMQPTLELKDLAGDSPFKKARMVITKIAGLDIQQKLWDRVEAYRMVRNAIVHNAGELPTPLPQLVKQLLQQHPNDIQYSDGGGLVVKPELTLSFASACEALLEAVLDKWLALVEAEELNTRHGGRASPQ